MPLSFCLLAPVTILKQGLEHTINVSLIAKFTVRTFHKALFWFARSSFFNALCVSAFYTQYTSVLYNEFTIFNKIVEVNFGFLKIQENN